MNLSFSVLDDLCLGVERGRVDSAVLSLIEISEIGPAIEAWHQSKLFEDRNLSAKWAHSSLTTEILTDFTSGISRTQLHGAKMGWIVGPELFEMETRWLGFVMMAKKAAENAGFDRKVANGITGALEEFRSNISDHSQSANSRYAAFFGDKGTYEFVVGDFGVGALNSLQTHSKYSNLTDHGEALKLALTEGVSRHTDMDRGNGFRPLLVGLANIAGHVRFRSGDHSYEIDKISAHKINVYTNQRVHMQGFSCATKFSIR